MADISKAWVATSHMYRKVRQKKLSKFKEAPASQEKIYGFRSITAPLHNLSDSKHENETVNLQTQVFRLRKIRTKQISEGKSQRLQAELRLSDCIAMM